MTKSTTETILDDDAIAEANCKAAIRKLQDAAWNCGTDEFKESISDTACNRRYDAMVAARAECVTTVDALCNTVRALKAENERLNRLIAQATVTAPWEAGYSDYVPTAGDPVRSVKDLIAHIRERGNRAGELESSVTFWQAEALLGHFCSEHAKNTRQAGHYCTICAKPFVMSVPQGTRPPKYEDLQAENADLQSQLEQVTKERDEMRQRERGQLTTVIEIRGCDKCELCGDHQ